MTWLAFVLSTAGVLLNAHKDRRCWPVWCLSNCIWIWHFVALKDWPSVATWAVFTAANLYAWVKWSR